MLRLGESVPSRRAHLRLSAAASELVAIGQNPAPLPLVGQLHGGVGHAHSFVSG